MDSAPPPRMKPFNVACVVAALALLGFMAVVRVPISSIEHGRHALERGVQPLEIVSDGPMPASSRAMAAAPTSGAWKEGDLVWSTSASASGAVGWMCVASGTPGRWIELHEGD